MNQFIFTLILTFCTLTVLAEDLLESPPHYGQQKLEAIYQTDLSALEQQAKESILNTSSDIEKLLNTPDTPLKDLADGYGKLGGLYQLHSHYALAELCYKNAYHLNPKNFHWVYYLGLLAVKSGRPEEALKWMQQAQKLDETYFTLYLHMAQAHLDINQLDKAQQLFTKISKTKGLEAAASYGLGQISLLTRDYKNAIHWFQLVLKFDPEATQVHYSIAKAYRAIGNKELTKQHLKKHGKTLPKAKDPLADELKLLASGPTPHYLRAMNFVINRDYIQGSQHFAKGIAIDENNQAARISYARALYLSDQPQLTKDQLHRIIQQNPNNSLALFLLGLIYDAENNAPLAIQYYQKVLHLDPQHTGAHYFLANTLMKNKRYSQASKHYKLATHLEPNNLPAHLYGIVSLIQQGEPDIKIKIDIEAAYKRFPDNPIFSFLLIKLLAQSNDPQVKDEKRALDLANQLVESQAIPPHLELLAIAHAAAGNFQQAIQIQSQ